MLLKQHEIIRPNEMTVEVYASLQTIFTKVSAVEKCDARKA